MKRRTIIAGLAGGLVLCGLFLLLRHRSDDRVGAVPPERSVRSRARPNRFQAPASAEGASAPTPRTSSFLQGARETVGGRLSSQEERVLDRLYAQLVAEREKIELSVLKVETVDAHTVMITIPEYTERGLELYADFGDELMAEIGRDRGREVLQGLDALIRANNAQFGFTEQNLLIEDQGETVHIVHGSGAVVNVNGQASLADVRSGSVLKKTALLKYEYLRPYLPGAK